VLVILHDSERIQYGTVESRVKSEERANKKTERKGSPENAGKGNGNEKQRGQDRIRFGAAKRLMSIVTT